MSAGSQVSEREHERQMSVWKSRMQPLIYVGMCLVVCVRVAETGDVRGELMPLPPPPLPPPPPFPCVQRIWPVSLMPTENRSWSLSSQTAVIWALVHGAGARRATGSRRLDLLARKARLQNLQTCCQCVGCLRNHVRWTNWSQTLKHFESYKWWSALNAPQNPCMFVAIRKTIFRIVATRKGTATMDWVKRLAQLFLYQDCGVWQCKYQRRAVYL